jgi:large subunit ribosomal protein L25
MATYPTLEVAARTGIGRSASHKLRRQHVLPASVCGHGESQSLQVDAKHFHTIMHGNAVGSLIVRLSIDGKDGGLALVKDVQHAPVTWAPIHVDMQRVSSKELLEVAVPVLLHGEPVGVHQGGMLETLMHTITLRCAADSVPANIEHDISAMEMGGILHTEHLTLPEGAQLVDRPDEIVAIVRRPRVQEEVAESTSAETTSAEPSASAE